MKNKKNLKYNKGFSLVECVMAIAIFAVMSLLLFGILMQCMVQRRRNLELSEGVSAQIDEIITGGIYGMSSAGVPDYRINFYSDGTQVASIGSDGAQIGFANYYTDSDGFRLYKPYLDIREYKDWLKARYPTP